MNPIRIGRNVVGTGERTFVVAEIGINHNGDVKVARCMIEAAANAGADAVKFQTYLTEKRVAPDSPIREILERCELGHGEQASLKELADELGVVFFSTPFDHESVAFLDQLGVEVFKIASFDLVNGDLLRRVAATGKPIIASRGMADRSEIEIAVDLLRSARSPFALLHCVSAYPTPPEQANLRVIRTLESYGCPVGYSDHTLGVDVPVLAVAAGACIIEKHFTLDRNLPGPDQALSADPPQLREMVTRIREVETTLGSGEPLCLEVEREILPYRRAS